MKRVDETRSGTSIVTSTLVSCSPFSRTILLETIRTRRARGGSRRRRREGSVTLRALLVSGVGTLSAPCAACSYSGGGYYSGCNSPFSYRDHLGYALSNCNPNWYSSETFENCVDDNGVSISNWDVSGVTYMSQLLSWRYTSAQSFNADISRWDVSAVRNMYSMFSNAQSFNGDLSSWDVSSVNDMSYIFSSTQSFNGDLSNWDVSSVTNMQYMFRNAQSFNGDLSNWNTANVNSNAYRMFYGATAWLNNHVWVYDSNADYQSYNGDGPPDRWCRTGSNCAFPADGSALKEAVFNCLNANSDGNCDCSQSWINCRHGLSQPMSEWDVSKVTHMRELFRDQRCHDSASCYYKVNAQSFNADLSNWNTASVTDMSAMFSNAQNFNGDISRWNTHAVTSMSSMFQNAHSFNGDLSNWNTQSLAYMQNMFENAHSFNADITEWTCDAYERSRTRDHVDNMFTGADAWHASYVNTHTGYFDRDLGPPSMWVPVDEYDDSFFAKDERVQILIAFVAVLGALVAAMGIFLIVRCATQRQRAAKKVATQFRIAHAHNAVSQRQQILGMAPMPPGPPVLPGRSPIVPHTQTLPLVSNAGREPKSGHKRRERGREEEGAWGRL